MTKNELLTAIAAILTTALETEPSPFPESMAYLALGSNMSKWDTVKCTLVSSDLVTITRDHAIELTAKGRQLAERCNAALAR